MMGNRMTVGIVIARSVEVPSPAGEIFYTVEVHEGDIQPVRYANTKPQDYWRLSSVFAVDLIPFEVGQTVPIGITTSGSTEMVEIMAGELPNAGECPSGEG